MSRITHACRAAALSVPLWLLASTSISAQPSYPSYDPQLMPAQPTALDDRYIGFRDPCNRLRVESPVMLRESGFGAELELRVRLLSNLCVGTPPPLAGTLFLIELPRGASYLPLQMRMQHVDGEVWLEKSFSVSNLPFVPESVTGSWSDPAHPAQGLIVSAGSVPVRSGHTVAWNTYDANGDPLWLVGAAERGTDLSTSIPLYQAHGGAFPGRGTGAPDVQAWGTIRLEYLGCGRMGMRWEALDPVAFPPGHLMLEQLTRSAQASCDVIGDAQRRGQRIERIVPEVIVTR